MISIINEGEKSIKVAFADFYVGFDYHESFLYQILSEHYDVVIDEDAPEFVIYSCFGTEFLKYENAVRIFYTGENVFPNFNFCDYAVSFVRSSVGGRNLFFPLAYNHALNMKEDTLCAAPSDACSRKFCSFVYSNDSNGEGAVLRKKFCQQLMDTYKHVDCAGRVLHNYDGLQQRYEGDEHEAKVEMLSQYKFNIAFENSNSDGYMTEKLTDPLLANTVPIYWGSEGNLSPFTKNAVICANDFASLEDLIEYIKHVDNNDEAYHELLLNNPLRSNLVVSARKQLTDFLVGIVESGKKFEKDSLKFDPLLKFRFLSQLPAKAFRIVNKLAKLYIKYFSEKK